jgi:VanZ family protein
VLQTYLQTELQTEYQGRQLARRRRLLLKDWTLISFWLLAFIATHLPKVPQSLKPVSDKTLHTLSFTILAGLLSWVLHNRVRGTVRHGAAVLMIIAIYGALDELLPIPVGRHCDFYDWIADMLGGIAGMALYHIANRAAQAFRRPVK